MWLFVNSLSLCLPTLWINSTSTLSVSNEGAKEIYTSLFHPYVRVSICVENIGLWCFRVITRPVRSTRVSSTSGRRSFVFMAFRLWQSETMLTHTGICACVTTLPMEFRRYFTSVCRMAFCNGATTNAINSFHGMFPPIHSESGFADPFSNRRHIRVIAYSIFSFRVAKINSDNTTGATLRRRGLPNDDKRRRDY